MRLLTSQISALDGKVKQFSDLLAQLSSKVAALPNNDPTRADLASQINSLTNQINALAVSGDTVYVGGGLHFPINGSSYPYLGVFPPRGWSVLSQARFTNGNFSFRLLGEEGSNYVIQASATLTNWLSVYTNSVANGAFGYSEPATNKSVRYYRAVSGQ